MIGYHGRAEYLPWNKTFTTWLFREEKSADPGVTWFCTRQVTAELSWDKHTPYMVLKYRELCTVKSSPCNLLKNVLSFIFHSHRLYRAIGDSK